MKSEYRIKALRRMVGKAINRYAMIGNGDRVLVALSGGLDSLALLDAVTERRARIPISYSVTAEIGRAHV